MCSHKQLFQETPQQAQALQELIAQHQCSEGALMPVLQQAQGIYGYLPLEVQERIAEGLDIALEEVYGVVTFYSQFSLVPKGRHQISVCLGTACYVKGAGDIFKRFADRLGIQSGGCTPDGQFSLDACRCVGACGLAPVVMIGEEVYGRMSVEKVDDLLAKYQKT